MPKSQKVIIYLMGFVLGCLILAVLPREKKEPRQHPWHKQTAPEGYYPLSIEDDFGRDVTIERQPRHFISLAPSVTEILFAMDMGDHLMAVTDWCLYPEEAKELRDMGATIGSMNQPSRELIAQYRPDLIIGTTFTPLETVSLLHSPPSTVSIALKHDGFNDVIEDIRTIGKITGVPGRALKLISSLEEGKRTIEASVAEKIPQSPAKALFLLSLEDNGKPGWAPGKNSWIGDMINQLGALNVAETLGQEWGQPSYETLIALNPSILIIREPEDKEQLKQLNEKIASLGEHAIWSKVEAVKNGRVHTVPYGPFTIPGPRIIKAYGYMADVLYPAQN